MLELLWGWKTVAMLDVWSFAHLLSGISVGYRVKKNNSKHLKLLLGKTKLDYESIIRFDIIAILALAYMWETFEHYLEQGLFGGAVTYWFQGVEAITNRFIADPLILVLGYYVASRYPKLVIPARVASGVWLFVHIFIFPHSMYLQQFL